ncbi:MAG: dihydroorotase [Deltaproteobacteria bacterium]
MKILIKNGRLIDYLSDFDGVTDIYIEDGIVKEIGNELEYLADEIIDCTGFCVIPGMVDMHCHLREPGYEYKESIETGVNSAAAGGFTSIACMPNTNPMIDNQVVVEFVKEKARRAGKVNVFPIGCITKGQNGLELAEIAEMKLAGIAAISDDGKPVSNPLVMKRALQYAKMFEIPVISHCEDKELVDEGVMNEGYTSTILGLKGIPKEAEEVMVARDVILAENNDCHVHIAHISTKGSVEIIRNAKKRNVKVTAETCPHYFSITEEAITGFNTNAKVNPPLRTKEDVEAIKKGLADGTIDIIATDHAPHHIDDKNVEFNNAAFGISGFETALSLCVTNLLQNNVLTYKQLVEKISYNPSKMLGINRGSISVGSAADITIFAPNDEVLIDAKIFKSKGKNTPFDGYRLKGKVCYTIVDGRIVAKN